MANKTGTIVIDPGHGGSLEIGGSSANNARSPSGVLEKNITLRMAFLVKEQIAKLEPQVRVILTRDKDVNLGLADRARVARNANADLFLSIHCNAFHKDARGTETLISPVAGNANHAADKKLGKAVKDAVFNVFKKHDPTGAKDRGVKDQSLGVLRDANLGTTVRGCMLEIEFIHMPKVDQLLNVGSKSPAFREELAVAIANALISQL